ncbi:MAG: DNA polymerase III subunit beta [Bacteroidaceae bacterium]|nr:DNA polymerase III subunit beta [Bacteroidaceae bacterium]
MNFTVSSTTLSSCLQALSRVLNSKSALPILDSFLFDVADNKLTITASDGENVITTSVDLIDSNESFSFCLYSKTIIDAVKEFAEEPLSFDINTMEMSATIKYHNGQNRIPVQAADAYPRIQMNDGPMTEIKVAANSLEKAITRSLFATTQDELRPVMNGLYFDLKSDSLTIVASDGHKLVRNENREVKGNEPASFILPKKPSTLLKSLLPKDGDVSIKFNAATAVLEFGTTKLTCRLIEGRYPNYNSVIPQNNPNELTIDRQALLGALRRVLVFASQSSYLICFRLENNKLTLSSEDIDFSKSANEELTCEYFGQQMSIGFKGTTLIEVLNNIDSQEVVFKLADPSRAGVVVPATQNENEDLLMLFMPMMLND